MEKNNTSNENVAASSEAVTVFQNSSFAAIAGDPEYVDMIHSVCHTIAHTENQILDSYWTIGDTIQSFIDAQDSKNVTAALDKISQHVSEASNCRLNKLGAASLRKALKVRKMLDKNQLELAKAGCVSLRNLLSMCGNDVTDDERDMLLQDVSEGNLIQTEIPAKVKEIHPPAEKKENRGGARKKPEDPLEFMKRVQEEMDNLLADMESYRLHAATALGSEDQATKEKYTQYYEANAERIEKLNKKWAANEKVTQVFLVEE